MHHLHRAFGAHTALLQKTISYYLLHMVVAASVGWAVTGSLQAALALSLLEPTVQAVAYFFHDKAWSRIGPMRARTLRKTTSYYVMHIAVASSVAYAVTGHWWQALSLSLLEPTVQMLFFVLHEKFWESRLQRRTVHHAALQVS